MVNSFGDMQIDGLEQLQNDFKPFARKIVCKMFCIMAWLTK